jgi:extradiol dioxygenase family protein
LYSLKEVAMPDPGNSINNPPRSTPIGHLRGMTLDVHDLALTKTFWQAVLGAEITFENDDWVAFDAIPGHFGLDLQRVPETKAVKNRAHLDIVLDDYETGINRLKALGAAVLQEVSLQDRRWSIMADPEGNEFCAIWIFAHD